MASDGVLAGISASIPATTAAGFNQVSQPTATVNSGPAGGNSLPQGGKASASTAGTAAANAAARTTASTSQRSQAAAQQATATHKSDLQSLVVQLNKYLNDSGRSNQFRVEPGSGDGTIQEVNPANGQVIGEYSSAEFPALARSLGISGVLVDSRA